MNTERIGHATGMVALLAAVGALVLVLGAFVLKLAIDSDRARSNHA